MIRTHFASMIFGLVFLSSCGKSSSGGSCQNFLIAIEAYNEPDYLLRKYFRTGESTKISFRVRLINLKIDNVVSVDVKYTLDGSEAAATSAGSIPLHLEDAVSLEQEVDISSRDSLMVSKETPLSYMAVCKCQTSVKSSSPYSKKESSAGGRKVTVFTPSNIDSTPKEYNSDVSSETIRFTAPESIGNPFTFTLASPRAEHVAAFAGTKIFIAGGVTDAKQTALDTIEVYDLKERTLYKTGLIGRRRNHSIATAGDKFLVAGGMDTIAIHWGTVDIFDAANGTFSLAKLSKPRIWMAPASRGTKAIFAGGYGGEPPDPPQMADVDIYDSATGQWSVAQLSVARYDMVSVVAGDKAVFLGGSYDVEGERPPAGSIFSKIWDVLNSDAVDIYDFSKGIWSVAKLPVKRCCMAGASSGNKVLLAGGYADLHPDNENYLLDRIDIYDTDTGQWSTAMLSEARSYPAAVAIGTKTIFAGGFKYGGASNAVDIYDSSTKKWSTAKLSRARGSIRAVSSGTKAFFIGGDEDKYPGLRPGIPSRVVDVYDLATDSWSNQF
ncbi:MAG: hypothetical protein HQK54_07795 [Oligoflexales bacterium]|nr:hypothetical protein [Oligoflexales bacterium]